MSPEKEAKDNILTLRAGNALLEIIPEVGGSITRYCLVTEGQTLNFSASSDSIRVCQARPKGNGKFPTDSFFQSNPQRSFQVSGAGNKIAAEFLS